ncbi:MAG: ChbG/HpnK family deacetylase [Acidobacteriia bacterium]|nr:ChbG/HpnK family deacetylase [Terriglobia bacterium]
MAPHHLDASGAGRLILNADDWGLDRQTTDRIWECAIQRRISSVSAMVFMEDSERAATLGQEAGIDAGLHLNLTTPFSAKNCSARLIEQHRQIVAGIRRYRFSRALFHPGLRRQFEYVVAAQLEEFQRLYGAPAARVDGHHHIHLCPNVVLMGLLPAGIIVRRNFSFRRGEKSAINRLYRSAVDRVLARRHVLADYFFSLAPLEPLTRLQEIISVANRFSVEVETHPAILEEYNFLTGDSMPDLIKGVRMALPAPAGSSPANWPGLQTTPGMRS